MWKRISEICLKLLHILMRFIEINIPIQRSLALPGTNVQRRKWGRGGCRLSLCKEQEFTFQKIIMLRLSVDENWGHWGISHPWWDNKRVIPSLFTLPTGLFSFLWVWSEWDQEQARTCAKLWPVQSCSATAAATETSAQLSKPTTVFAKHIYLENISKIFAFKSV